MATETKRYTADEFWDLCAHLPDGRRYELVDGELVEMSPTGGEHGGLAIWLGSLLVPFIRARGLGRVVGTDTGFILSTNPDRVRALDIGFLSRERWPGPLPKKFIPIAPDLAVEVVSPGDTASEIQEKVIEYLQAGTRLVWVLYPSNRTVNVFPTDGAPRLLDIHGVLDGGDVLPGFQLSVRELFEGAES